MAGTEDKEWFYMSLGHRRGPVTRENLSKMLLSEELFVESTQVWRDGMKEWEGLADCKAFASTLKKVRETAQKTEANVRHTRSSEAGDEDLTCRGASRALFNLFFYIGWVIPILIGVIILTELQVHQLLDPKTVIHNDLQYIIPIGLLLLVSCQIAVSRMRHAGYPAWLGATIFIPVWNLFVLFICLLAPRNFRIQKKLGKAAIGYLVLLLVMFALPFSGLLTGVTPQSANIFSLTDGISDSYKYQTSYSARINKNQSKSADAEARRKAMEESHENEGREGALRKRTNQQ
ncbi:GYF domain-containing protein [Rubritalea sp.]|uniref:GYF domain-containing protein n=1 Tax=Rubritalea sp. TaxID=2109375 RepID=UPI003EF69F87